MYPDQCPLDPLFVDYSEENDQRHKICNNKLM